MITKSKMQGRFGKARGDSPPYHHTVYPCGFGLHKNRISEQLFTVVGPYSLVIYLRSSSDWPEQLMGTIGRKNGTNATPSHNAISTSAPLSFGSSIRRRSPSARIMFSWILRARTTASVLSRIRDLVTGPNYTPSSVAPIVDYCAASLSASEFSNLLQSLNVWDHTAMYWAIVYDRREALSALVGYISQISPDCADDLRLACMLVNDHPLFTQLGLELETGRKCTVGTNIYPSEY